ncbi:two component sensor kinase [Clostridium sp. CAG:964]|nr:two component sensor kinase [Clostridium sp. CAG:964]
MIKKLRIKLVTVLTLILSLVLGGILAAVNIFNYNINMEEAYRRLGMITSRAIIQDDPLADFSSNSSGAYDKNYGVSDSEIYLSYVGIDDEIKGITAANETNYTYEQISAFTSKALSRSAKQGKIDKLIYTITDINYGAFGKAHIVGFMNNSDNINNFSTMAASSVIIWLVGSFIILILSLLLSMWLIKPVEDAFNRQKQFISDASHELKTPIAVISANADILAGDIGENKWLGYIQSESERMSKLINDLLTLTRIEMQSDKAQSTRFDICNTLMEVTMPFESVSFEKGIILECEPEGEIFINGNEGQIKQVVAILVDNAIKHCYDGGSVTVTVVPAAKSRCKIRVSNTGEPIPEDVRKKIFERFYRADESRNRDNNRYGLGLAIAKQIVDNHNGSIDVSCDMGYTSFEVTI